MRGVYACTRRPVAVSLQEHSELALNIGSVLGITGVYILVLL